MRYIIACMFLLCATVLGAQEIPQHKVPFAVVESFQNMFSNASDIEWKKTDSKYKVEFEIGVFTLTFDHEVWYDSTGKMLKHKEEISKNDIPEKVLEKMESAYPKYRLEKARKITEKSEVIYEVKLKQNKSKLKMTFDKDGNMLSKKID